MTIYFEDFKNKTKGRMRIPIPLVEKHVKDICFLVDIEFTYIQAALPRVRWLKPLGYEVNVDEASTTITTLLFEEIDKEEKHFGTYDIVKSRVDTDLKIASSLRKKDKIVKKLKAQLGVDDEEDNEDDVEEQGRLAITQGLGEDVEQDEAKKAKQAPVVHKKRKAKAPPKAKPQKKVTKPSLEKPTTRIGASTRAATQREKEHAKERANKAE